ncbi:heavy-metal-associated domain-containing protein [Arthrobacter sp. B1I2]|uniref:heavy-metal-associated domain-containing protein n=1 Tax=Arthrobacter sp. B1I2 TaxID=3042263 RepID=UPI002785D712|nr:cation transporter [Arthrobacter sp. B1I2]MDQ0731026.1 copper chaperone [Arthrobacter sp. B1I2]
MNIGNRPQLPLASSGCSCCAPAGTAEPATTLPVPAAQQSPAAVGSSDAEASSQRDFAVEGMTCGHCVRSVETAVSAVAGVASASVDLVPGGRSRLTVKGSASDADVRQAVAAAGYALA